MHATWWGLATALCWATATMTSARAARELGQWVTVAWVMLVGLVVVTPLLLLGTPGGPGAVGATAGALTARTWLLLLVVGAGNVLGLVAAYAAFRVGKVGVVSPVIAAEGAVAAVVAALFGDTVAPVVAALLAVIVLGVVVAGAAPDPAPVAHERPVASVVYAVTAAVVFGVGLFANGRVGDAVPAAWVVSAARVVGVVGITVPLALAGRLRLSRAAAPYVLACGTAEVVGIFTFTFGARESTGVTAVVASQYAPLVAVLAFVLFRERLGRLQVAGVALVVAGVTALAATGG